ncbi:hypothetical protein ACIQ9R_36210 [Streptomyces sp. NPDC094447]|uniref:hypothetical protein n=1 Tax=Streptomyces sp. NPDC094447 TaxID=3366062 RepID=UPI0037FEE730
MSTIVPAAALAPTAAPVRYFAEHWAGVQTTRRAEGARREDWVSIVARGKGPDPVARFTAPYDSGEGFVGDRLLNANGWRALDSWEYVAGRNAYRTEVEPLRPYVTAVQAAVRAVEERPARDTLGALDAALCNAPVTTMDDFAETSLHDALRVVSLAEDADEWAMLEELREELAKIVGLVETATTAHPAFRALVLLAAQCETRFRAGDGAAWNAAWFNGLAALRRLSEMAHSTEDPDALSKAGMAFINSVQRAIAASALYESRRALVAIAEAYGLFVIGMRQPAPEDSWADYSRRIGRADYLFEVVPPFVAGFPYGAIRVQRVAEDGTQGPARFFPRSSDDKARAAVETALSRI